MYSVTFFGEATIINLVRWVVHDVLVCGNKLPKLLHKYLAKFYSTVICTNNNFVLAFIVLYQNNI